jgi:hypothetical protein
MGNLVGEDHPQVAGLGLPATLSWEDIHDEMGLDFQRQFWIPPRGDGFPPCHMAWGR